MFYIFLICLNHIKQLLFWYQEDKQQQHILTKVTTKVTNYNVKHSHDLTQDLSSFLFLSFNFFLSQDNTMNCPIKHKSVGEARCKVLQKKYHYSLSL